MRAFAFKLALLLAAVSHHPHHHHHHHHVRWHRDQASEYGDGRDGQLGNPLACGGRLQWGELGVAHKSLPCGTRVTFGHGSRRVTVRVIDRGPYVAGRVWDLTSATARRLGFAHPWHGLIAWHFAH